MSDSKTVVDRANESDDIERLYDRVRFVANLETHDPEGPRTANQALLVIKHLERENATLGSFAVGEKKKAELLQSENTRLQQELSDHKKFNERDMQLAIGREIMVAEERNKLLAIIADKDRRFKVAERHLKLGMLHSNAPAVQAEVEKALVVCNLETPFK